MPWLDLFRFGAALLVVAVHSRAASVVPFASLPIEDRNLATAAFFALTRIGNEAVIAFFVLSGFLVGGHAFERIRRGAFDAADYAIERITRIYLPLVPALVLTAATLVIRSQPIDFRELAGNLLGLQNVLVNDFGGNAPLWSLAFEMWFYLLAGAVGLVVLYTGAPRLLGYGVLALFAAVFCKLQLHYLACWIIGAAAFAIPASGRAGFSWLAGILFAIAGIASIEIQTVTSTGKPLYSEGWMPSIEASRILLSAGIALCIRQLAVTPVRALWQARVAGFGHWGARFSYSLFLTHYPVNGLLSWAGLPRSASLDGTFLGSFAVRVLVSIAVALLVYALSERHTPAVRRAARAWLFGRTPMQGFR